MRIIGGSAAGTILKVPKGFEVRPTPDLVRQAIFNSLGPRVGGRRGAGGFCRNRRIESGMPQPRRGQRRLRRKIKPPRPIHPAKPRPGPPARGRAGNSRSGRFRRPGAICRRRLSIRFAPGRSALRRKKCQPPLDLPRPTIAGRRQPRQNFSAPAGFSFSATPNATPWIFPPSGMRRKMLKHGDTRDPFSATHSPMILTSARFRRRPSNSP